MSNTVEIKKAFVDVVKFLEDNKNKKVETIFNEVLEMCATKKKTETVLYDDKGNAYAIYCYYHKQWELLSEVEYGKKASAKSGYNTMCKIGTNQWTKQQKEAEKAKAAILDGVAKGEIDPSLIKVKLDEVEQQRQTINMENAPVGTQEAPALK